MIYMRVYRVSADGERTAVSGRVEYEPTRQDPLPVSFGMPPCECPRCLARNERVAS
ncbi:hypothetical protein [Streptacidiphilus sp. P02-A3a]|uniref:hypothetical protein n=1 Tax=Streptacidiphilus sp. P02-A3a TaxID=2704468 RepID=UPI0015F7C3D1|nr:hypothetical protein [Streptacidiphilus sp. P02-A3a]QMU67407.1 hypothetical protein GXP74_03430 [Streptacidiphilus sp. P02-A3a]